MIKLRIEVGGNNIHSISHNMVCPWHDLFVIRGLAYVRDMEFTRRSVMQTTGEA